MIGTRARWLVGATVGATALAAAGCSGGGPPCEPEAGTICTVVGTGEAGHSEEAIPAWQAPLYLPMDITVRPKTGRLYLTDWNNHRIRRVDDEGLVHTVAGNGRLGDGPEGPALEAAFNHPTDMVFDGEDNMILAAWHNSRIDRVSLDTQQLDFYCGAAGARSYAGNGGPAEDAAVDLPSGLDYGPEGNLYFVDQANQVIRRITPSGTIEHVAGQCITGTCDGGEAPVACSGNDKTTCVMDETDDACSLACEPAFGGDGGPAPEARFAFPTGQAADPSGRLKVAEDGAIYVADTGNNRIRRISADRSLVETIAGTGEGGYSGDGGPATEARLRSPRDPEIADDGSIYFTDTDNSCIRVIRPDGTIDTAVGQCGRQGFEGDGGPPRDAVLDRPYGIELHEGRLYIADTHNHRIRVVVLEGSGG